MEERELAYKRKARLRGKNRKIRIEMVADPVNVALADKKARKGKANHKGVKIFDRSKNENLDKLIKDMLEGKFVTSPGHTCQRLCPCGKVRTLFKLPYFPRPYRATLVDASANAHTHEIHRVRLVCKYQGQGYAVCGKSREQIYKRTPRRDYIFRQTGFCEVLSEHYSGDYIRMSLQDLR